MSVPSCDWDRICDARRVNGTCGCSYSRVTPGNECSETNMCYARERGWGCGCAYYRRSQSKSSDSADRERCSRLQSQPAALLESLKAWKRERDEHFRRNPTSDPKLELYIRQNVTKYINKIYGASHDVRDSGPTVCDGQNVRYEVVNGAHVWHFTQQRVIVRCENVWDNWSVNEDNVTVSIISDGKQIIACSGRSIFVCVFGPHMKVLADDFVSYVSMLADAELKNYKARKAAKAAAEQKRVTELTSDWISSTRGAFGR